MSTALEVLSYGTKVHIGDGVVGRVIGVFIRGDVVQYDVEWVAGSDYKSAYMHEDTVLEMIAGGVQRRTLGFKGGKV